MRKFKEWLATLNPRPKPMSEFGRALSDALRDDEWEQKEHYLIHKLSDLRMWTSNGPSNFHPYVDGDLNIHKHLYPEWEKDVCWQLYRNTANRIMANMLRLSAMKGNL